jgi:hypothetical protein
MSEKNEIPASIAAIINKGKAHQKSSAADEVPVDEKKSIEQDIDHNVGTEQETNTSEKENIEETKESGLSSGIKKSVGYYKLAFKKNRAVTVIVTALVGVYLLSIITPNKDNSAQNNTSNNIAEIQTIQPESIELEGFGEIEIPDIAEPFESTLTMKDSDAIDEDPILKINSLALSEQEIPIDEDLNGILDNSSSEMISDLQLEVDTVSTRVATIEDYSSTEIERLISEVKSLTSELSNVKKEVSQKKFDLGYEKDRPDIELFATVPAPDDCSDCIAHASFKFDNVDYQAGNDSMWHSFKVQIAGNRMSLVSNDYVYDYWVGQ